MISKKFQPRGFDILYEDKDLIIGNKAAGFLTVAAKWNKDRTIHSSLNHYVRKGNARSKNCVYVVHRLDQATSGVLVFAKSEETQEFLKDNWATTQKIYYAIVHGSLHKKSGLITSYLSEDENYLVHSSQNPSDGKLAKTEYEVVKENSKYSLIKVNLLTGRKNQIRRHMSDLGHPIVGDDKYGSKDKKSSLHLALHSYSIELTHPFSKKRLKVSADMPRFFTKLIE